MKQKTGEFLRAEVGKVGTVIGHLCLLTGFAQRISIFSLVFMIGGTFILGARHPLKLGSYPTMEIFSDGYISETSQVLEKGILWILKLARGFEGCLYTFQRE